MKSGLVYILCLSLAGLHLTPMTQRFDCAMSGQRNQPTCCCEHVVSASRPSSCCIRPDGTVSHTSMHRTAAGAIVTRHMTASGAACCNATSGSGTTAVVTHDSTNDKARPIDAGRSLWPALTAAVVMADLAHRGLIRQTSPDAAHPSSHSPGRVVLHCTFLI